MTAKLSSRVRTRARRVVEAGPTVLTRGVYRLHVVPFIPLACVPRRRVPAHDKDVALCMRASIRPQKSQPYASVVTIFVAFSDLGRHPLPERVYCWDCRRHA